MRLQHPFEVVTSGVDGAVLAALARADGGCTGRGLHRAMGRYSSEGVRRSLERLVSQGIVDMEDLGSAKRYELNRDHLAARHLIAIAGLYDTFVEQLRDRLAAWEPRPRYAALFGSTARHEMTADSDIDIFIVRPDPTDADDPQWATQRMDLTLEVSRWTGNDCRLLEYSETETHAGLSTDEPVLADIADHGVHLLGSPTYLHPATGGQAG